jgi:transposase
MKDFLTPKEVEILEEAHHDTRFRKQADRIKTILFLNRGFNYPQTAALLMLDDTTVRRYYQQYQKDGIDGLLEDHYAGSISRLTKTQEIELIAYLRKHTYRKVSQIIKYVKQTYKIEYSVDGMTHLLHRIGFSYKKLKIVPGKMDKVKQEEFKQTYSNLKATKNPEDKIYFLDASHLQHNSIASYGWIYTNTEKAIKTNTARKRINLNGALNLEDMDITVLSEPTINADAVIRLLKAIEEKQPTGEIFLILDNARYNHAKKLKHYVKRRKRIHLMHLPAYSPNLNIIERLWKFFKEEKLYGKYYETYQEFTTVVMDFFRNIDEYKETLKTRLTDSFQTMPN